MQLHRALHMPLTSSKAYCTLRLLRIHSWRKAEVSIPKLAPQPLSRRCPYLTGLPSKWRNAEESNLKVFTPPTSFQDAPLTIRDYIPNYFVLMIIPSSGVFVNIFFGSGFTVRERFTFSSVTFRPASKCSKSFISDHLSESRTSEHDVLQPSVSYSWFPV